MIDDKIEPLEFLTWVLIRSVLPCVSDLVTENLLNAEYDLFLISCVLKLIVPYSFSKYGNKCFSITIIGPRIYNKLPLHVTSSISTESFKQSLKTHLFLLSENELENLYNWSLTWSIGTFIMNHSSYSYYCPFWAL